MLCSACSAEVRPVVAVDIDGTLADYHTHFIRFAGMWLNQPVAFDYFGDEPFREWAGQTFGIDVMTFRAIKLAYRQGGMKRNMPMYPGANELVRELRRRAEVWLTTTRPHERYDRIDPDTVEWLRRKDIEHDGLLYDEHKMDALAARVDPERVVAVLDDQPGVLSDAAYHFGSMAPILRRTSYNSEIIHKCVAPTFRVALREINTRLDAWEEQNR